MIKEMKKGRRGSRLLRFKTPKGIVYHIRFRKPDVRTWGDDCCGVCFFPVGGEGKIYVSPHRGNQTQLNTLIHEVTHAYFGDKTETEVTSFANTLSRILYGLKWRKNKN